MFEMIEKGIRGGISTILGKRFAKAHNKYVNNNYHNYRILDKLEIPDIMKTLKETKDLSHYLKQNYLFYIDANNLYGWAMSQALPYKDLKFLEVRSQDPNYYLEKCSKKIGMIFEVDLEYKNDVEKLKYQSFPLAPESKTRTYNELSDYQKNYLNINNQKISKVPKLVLDMNPKINYVVHYRLLDFYLKHGMKVTKIHNVILFKQKNWLKEYIDHNTNLRKDAKTDFEKDMYKLMNNSFFGKTMENVRKRINIKLVTNKPQAIKQISKPTFLRRTIFSNNLMAIHFKKQVTKLNKPIYLGFTILELSKLLMYEYYYNILKPRYGDNLELLYMDTDSFVLNITTEDLYKDLNEFKDFMDFSDYKENEFPESLQLLPEDYIKNKKVIGKFKDELGGSIMTEFGSLRSKSYGFITLDNKEKIKNKGTQKSVVKKEVCFDNMKETLRKTEIDESCYRNNRMIKSNKHEINVVETTKLSLNPYDDKRYIINDGINTSPFGFVERVEPIVISA